MYLVSTINSILDRWRHFLAALAIFGALISAQTVVAQETTEPDQPEDPVVLFNRGQDAHEQGDLRRALALYDRALAIIPEFPEAEYQRGMALLSLNRPGEAEQALRRALELREDWSLALTALGTLLVKQNKFAEADRILNRAIDLSEINFAAYSSLVDLKLKTKAPERDLLKLLERVQRLTGKANPTAGIWTARARLERTLGDREAAGRSLAQALIMERDYRPALFERAEAALTKGDHAAALQDALTLQKLSAPDDPEILFLLARVRAVAGRTDEARQLINRIQLPSAEVNAFREQLTADFSENPADLEARLEGDEKNSALLGRLCRLYRTADPAKSLEYCRRAYEAEPANINHVIGFGAALVQAGNHEPAVRLFRQVLTAAPDNYTARANLAVALFQLGRFEEAKSEYLWLTKKRPDLPAAFYFLAITHDRLREYIDAMAAYQHFLKIADERENRAEIERVNLRLPSLQKLLKKGKGKNDE